MTLLTIIRMILSIAEGLTRYADRKALMDAGEAKSIATSLHYHQGKLDRAIAAMRRADRMPPEDRFRPDE
jgi:hypothetical protein